MPRPKADNPIYVPAVCLVELVYLIEKNRLPAAARERREPAVVHQCGQAQCGPTCVVPGRCGLQTAPCHESQLGTFREEATGDIS
jgi:hypothetical protein